MATRSPRPASTWRSTQLYATLSFPSANHFANGAPDQSRVSLNGVDQESRLACFAQNASQSSSASRYSASSALACSTNCSAGGYDDGPSVWVAVSGFLLVSRLVQPSVSLDLRSEKPLLNLRPNPIVGIGSLACVGCGCRLFWWPGSWQSRRWPVVVAAS